MVGYVFFAKNQLNNKQNLSTSNTTAPTTTVLTPTPVTVDQVNVESPAADLNGIDRDVQAL